MTEAPNSCEVADKCFKIPHGFNEEGKPVYDYFSYEAPTDDGYYTNHERIENTGGLGDLPSAGSGIAGYRFINANDVTKYQDGGAIYNTGDSTIGNITADFISNSSYTTGMYASAKGGAIYNYYGATINDIRGDFIGNYNYSAKGGTSGSAIFNFSNMGNIIGHFIGNYAGDAIRNSEGIMGDITGDFIGNSDRAISNTNGAKLGDISGDFIYNYIYSDSSSGALGGAILNDRNGFGTSTSIDNISGNFIVNYTQSASSFAKGGAIYMYDSNITSIIGDFVGNYAQGYSGAEGGAIHNSPYNSSSTIEDMTANFVGNYAKSETGTAHGGAIYNTGNINLSVGASSVLKILFQNNYVQISDAEKQYEAIYNTGMKIYQGGNPKYFDSNLTFKATNNSSYTFYDYINGELYYNSSSDTYYGGIINFTGDGTGTFNLYNDIKNQKDINFQAGYVLNMISPEDIHKDVFTSKYSYIQAKNITVSAAIQMAVDVDLAAGTMDRFEAENFTIASGGSLNLTTFKIIADLDGEVGASSDPVALVSATTITGLVADETLTYVTEAVSDVYAYSVEYDEEGNFIFTKTGLKPQPEPEPKVRPGRTGDTKRAGAAAGAASATTAAVATQTMSHGGTSLFNGINSGDEPLGLTAWVQALGSNDDVELKHMSEKVDTQFYGLVGGIDSKRFTYDNGVNAVYGVFGAFVNGKQKLDDSKITNKSGYLGASVAFRKDRVFSNFTLTGGFIANEASSEFGKDKFDTKVVSVANKTGVDIQKGAWTITPSLLLSYTGIDTDDYTTKAGTKIDNDFMHVYTVAPELKVAKDFGEGFSGYAKVAYKMFFYSNEKIEADDVLMPAMSVKPYVEYGIGASKDWSKAEWNAKDLATYGEITRHDGGRTGWDLNLGLKLDF